jgi:hypothetical protein
MRCCRASAPNGKPQSSTTATVRFDVDYTPLAIDYDLDADGRIGAGAFDRWGDP